MTSGTARTTPSATRRHRRSPLGASAADGDGSIAGSGSRSQLRASSSAPATAIMTLNVCPVAAVSAP